VRAGSLIRLVLVSLVLAAIATAVAIFVPWLPDQSSKEAERIDFVFWFVTAICIGIFAVVAAISLYSMVKFRARPDDDSDGPPIHGHTGIEIAWTAIPLVLVIAMIIVSSVALAQNDRVPDNALKIEVWGQQFAWTFLYPPEGKDAGEDRMACVERDAGRIVEGCKASANLYLPLNRGVRLYLSARDVIHSFWVPEFRQKQDAVPGITTEITITPTELGNYRLICTELCGLGHALMRTRAIVLTPSDFEAWLRSRTTPGGMS
jgi:cytochrome c oxidase subunit II